MQLGRPRKLDERDVREAHRILTDGTASLDDIAARYAVSGITLTRAFTRHGLAG